MMNHYSATINSQRGHTISNSCIIKVVVHFNLKDSTEFLCTRERIRYCHKCDIFKNYIFAYGSGRKTM